MQTPPPWLYEEKKDVAFNASSFYPPHSYYQPLLTEEEKSVLALYASQHPENIALARKMCKPVLKLSQKALIQKAGLDSIHEHGNRFKELPPNIVYNIRTGNIAFNPLWVFEHCPFPIKSLKLASVQQRIEVDGNKVFSPLAKLPSLATLQTNAASCYADDYVELAKHPLVITKGLGSLKTLHSLTLLANFRLSGVDTFSDIQHLKKLKTLTVSLDDHEIVTFFKTIKSESIECLEINLRGNGNLSLILEEDLYKSFEGIAERLPNLFFIGGSDHYNILFGYHGYSHSFAHSFHAVMGQYFSDKHNKFKVRPIGR
jgi:hypothetical protein